MCSSDLRMIAPILAFTSQEIWTAMPHRASDDGECVLFNDIPDYDPALALDESEAERWTKLLEVRDVVLKALEEAREQGIKKNQDAEIALTLDSELGFTDAELAALFIVSKVTMEQGETVTASVKLSDAPKCPRCWNHDEHIGTPNHHAELCTRCAKVLGE